MKIGTKSVLFGVHQFLIHPWFVALAWWKLYGFPFDIRLWVAFFVHDLGYWGKPNMDRPEGEEHPRLGANIMYCLFGHSWWEFCMYHSRFWAKRNGANPSRLCVADKLSICITPAWLWLFLSELSGELQEYKDLTQSKYASMHLDAPTIKEWHANVCGYLRAWVAEHKDGRPDTWTPITDSSPQGKK